MSNTSDGPVNNRMMGHNSGLSAYEEQKIKNDFSFQLLSKTHVLEVALERLVKGEIRKSHAWILRCFARSLGAADGGTVSINRDEVCQELGISRDALRKRIYELRSMGYIRGDVVRKGQPRTEFILDDRAIDHDRILSDYITLIGQFCADERSKRAPAAVAETVPVAGTDRTCDGDNRTCDGDKPYPGLGQTVPVAGTDGGVPYPGLGQTLEDRTCDGDANIEKSASLFLEENLKNKGGEGVLFSDAELPMVQKADRVRIRAEEIFEEWWSLYPKTRRNGKGDCRDTFVKIATGKHKKRRADAELMLKAIKERRGIPADLDFAKAPSTYLNQGCWEDDPVVVRSSVFGGNRR